MNRKPTYQPLAAAEPWRVDKDPDGGGLLILGRGGDVVCRFPIPTLPRDHLHAAMIVGHHDLVRALEQAVARAQTANLEGDAILSAWLPGALAALARARGTEE